MLSRAALAGGRNTELIMQTENRLLAAVAAAEDAGAACDVFRELAPVFADGAHPGQTNAVIRRALDCIVRRFAETLDLEQAAEETGLNPSYLSFLFKKTPTPAFVII